MVSAFVLFMGEALIAYRLLPFDHGTQKLIHALLHSLALIASTIALWAMITFHSANDIPHFYSIHAILGLSGYIFFCVQWVGGIVTMVFPRLPDGPRAALLPFHKYVGVVIFLLTWLAMLTGLMDRQRLDKGTLPFQPAYRLANAAGACIVAAGAVILYHFSPVAKNDKPQGDVHARLLP